MTPNWVQIYEAARRANLAYEMDPVKSQQAFEATGLYWLGLYSDNNNQAVACIDNHGDGYLSISGTRFSQGKIWDLIDDSWLIPTSLGGGVYVTSGALEGVQEMWDWAKSLVPPSTLWHVEGHSLGGWRTRYTPLFVLPTEIGRLHSFESPKGANKAYWKRYKQQLIGLVSVVNERDLFVDLPFGLLNEWEHPMLPILWLRKDGTFSEIYPGQWPGGRSISDHSMDLVEARCKKLAGL